MIPWKYGFKGAKSIVRIHFTDQQPQTSWNMAAPSEYGFYANVNPNSTIRAGARRRSGGSVAVCSRGRSTQMFNGYGDQVAQLYQGLDLSKNY